jgi:2-oxoglutarate ferredoxin oxidoreductase subunit beta
MQSLKRLGHDPSDRLKAIDLAQDYGTRLYTGVFYRNPDPPPTYDAGVRERHAALKGTGPAREDILQTFIPH